MCIRDSLKGSSTRQNPDVIDSSKIEIPREIEHQCDDLTLFIDLFFVNGLPMLTCIDLPLRICSLVCLENHSKEAMYTAIDVILRSYNCANYFIKRIRGDNKLRVLLDDVLDDLDIEMDFVAQGNHVPEAERNNRTIGERIRAR